MNPLVTTEQTDDSRDSFNLGAMLLIALAGVVGTTITIWALHFAHIGTSLAATNTTRPLPRIAVVPFHSLSASQLDINEDQRLTQAVVGELDRFSRVEQLPAEMDTDPVLVGRELAVRVLLTGRIERSEARTQVNIHIISAKDGKQLWTGSFHSDSRDFSGLSKQIHDEVAPHLTALLD